MLARLKRAASLWPLAAFAITWPVFRVLRGLRPPRPRGPRFLVIQVAKIGDLVCTSGLFRELKRAVPDSHLTVEVLPSLVPVLAANPHVDEVRPLDDRRLRWPPARCVRWARLAAAGYDYLLLPTPNAVHVLDGWFGLVRRLASVVEVRGRCTTQTRSFEALRRVLDHEARYEEGTLTRAAYVRLLEVAGVRGGEPRLEHHLPAGARERARAWLARAGAGPRRVGISPGAGNRLKLWPADRFAAVASALAGDGATIVVVGAPGDRAEARTIVEAAGARGLDACGAFDLADLGGLLAELDLFVSVDTGPLYMASALGVPTVDVTGPIDPAEQPPLEAGCRVVHVDLDCRPCSHVLATARTCRTGHLRCLGDTTPAMVVAACREALGASVRPAAVN